MLLQAARAAIAEWLGDADGGALLADAPAELLEPRGVFVSLKRRRDAALRGCIGRAEACDPLLAAVRRAAVAAASADPRFRPVTRDELPSLAVQISVLGPLIVVRPEEVEVGRHGLLVRHRGCQGLLLPQVAAREGWDRERFLGQTCRKAGLPAAAWRDPDCRIEVFTALSFEDGEGRPQAPA